MITNCPVCGKLTCIHWPEHWVYRRVSVYYCSENCLQIDLFRDMNMIHQVMRKRRGNIIMRKITLEQKKKAVEIAISGGSPFSFLKQCGSSAPDKTWYAIKAALKKTDPETYAKIQDFRKKRDEPKTAAEAMTGMKDAADEFFGKCKEMGLKLDTSKPIDGGEWEKMETPESNKLKVAVIGKPETAGELKRETRYIVTAIKYPEIGEFYYDRKYNSIDWRTPEGEEVSMSPTAWKILQHDLKEIMTVLGVEV